MVTGEADTVRSVIRTPGRRAPTRAAKPCAPVMWCTRSNAGLGNRGVSTFTHVPATTRQTRGAPERLRRSKAQPDTLTEPSRCCTAVAIRPHTAGAMVAPAAVGATVISAAADATATMIARRDLGTRGDSRSERAPAGRGALRAVFITFR